jgi:hypothetical protein
VSSMKRQLTDDTSSLGPRETEAHDEVIHLVTWDVINGNGDLLATFDTEFVSTVQGMVEFQATENSAVAHAIAMGAWSIHRWHDGCCQDPDFFIDHESLVISALEAVGY